MKTIILGLAAAGILATAAPAAFAQDSTTVVKKEESGDRSKTVIKKDNGSKTVIKKDGDKEKKVHVNPAGEKTVIKKRTDTDVDH